MSITPQMVKDLREKSGAGMMDCKKALAESDGKMDEAFEILRKRGISIAQKKAGRVAADGLIGSYVSDSKDLGVLVEVNCETDFVTKTEGFQNFVSLMTDVVREKNPNDLEALLATNYNGKIVRDIQTDVIAKIGENLGIRRFSRIETKGTKKLARYIHAGSKIGVIAVFDDPNGKLDDVTSYEVCMHVAAMHPQYVRSEDVPESIVAKEKEIMLAQMGDTNKPADILEKILSGKVAKFYTEVCLENQVYVRDPEGKATVGKWLSKIDAAIKIASFVRLQVGEGVEKQSG